MRHLKHILIVGVLGIVLLVGWAAYTVFKTPAAASAITAIPLAPGAATVSGTDGVTTTADAVVLRISQADSEARFVIDEVLNGTPKTVVGTTDQVAGEIAVDPDNLAQTQVGVIQVNARDLTTDNDFRNRAIKNQILQTDQYEYITFTPIEISGLPQNGTVGELYSFQIVGDLTIRGVTKRVTFDVTAQAISTSRIEGTATATINYADYGITIPRVPQVASVADQVRLELDFAATAA
jgi:polyisoprenoid-binding protein YceI